MSEEKEPAVIVVARDHGSVQRYAAPAFGTLHDGTLVIGEKTGEDLRVDAAIAPGRWTAVCKDGTEVSDVQAEALGIARNALNRIWSALMAGGDASASVAAMREIADKALSVLVDMGYE